MSRNLAVAIVLIFSLVHVSVSEVGNCTAIAGKPSCVCKTTHGVIDLTPLSKTDGTPM